jgi:hypothetical protein
MGLRRNRAVEREKKGCCTGRIGNDLENVYRFVTIDKHTQLWL